MIGWRKIVVRKSLQNTNILFLLKFKRWNINVCFSPDDGSLLKELESGFFILFFSGKFTNIG